MSSAARSAGCPCIGSARIAASAAGREFTAVDWAAVRLLDPGYPRDAAGARRGGAGGAAVRLLPKAAATVCRLARWLTDLGVITPAGKPGWNAASVPDREVADDVVVSQASAPRCLAGASR